MTDIRTAKITFWQVIITSVITAVVSISVALITVRSETGKIDSKMDANQEKINSAINAMKIEIDNTRNDIILQNSKIDNLDNSKNSVRDQNNQNGANVGRDQNNNIKPKK